MNRPSGFTLIEILIAVAILSVMSVLAYGGMNYVLKSNAIIEQEGNHLEQFQVAFRVMANDLELALDRATRDRLGTSEKPFHAPPDRDGQFLLFTTNTGAPMQLDQAKSSLQRVEYELRDNQLVRSSWNVLDKAHNSEPVTTVLFDKVSKVQFTYVNTTEHEFWPLPAGHDEFAVLPRAVRMNLVMEDQLQIERLFLVRAL